MAVKVLGTHSAYDKTKTKNKDYEHSSSFHSLAIYYA